jgi:putative restriction endonuclease
MARPAPSELDEETFAVPAIVRFPVELTPPDGFDPARLETWPRVEGRLEWVEGRLLYIPPCGGLQQDTVTDLVTVLGIWLRSHPDFVVGTNEAGMRLGADTRAADAGVWRRSDLPAYDPGLRRVPPLLAAEVAGPRRGRDGAAREGAVVSHGRGGGDLVPLPIRAGRARDHRSGRDVEGYGRAPSGRPAIPRPHARGRRAFPAGLATARLSACARTPLSSPAARAAARGPRRYRARARGSAGSPSR